jgi:hypothetical protein
VLDGPVRRAWPLTGDVEVDAEVEQIAGRLRAAPPSCIRGFRLTQAELPVAWDDNCRSVWRLVCACGEDRGRILGYPLRDYDPEYDGPECFLSPLGFECSACGKVTEIMDTDLHGYHSEVAKIEGGVGSVKIRGEGARQQFPCTACRAQVFVVTAGFVYWSAAFDLFLDEPELPFQEFFNLFLSYGKCVACGEVSALTDFGKL